MNLPLDMRAITLAASLDVVSKELDAVRRGRPISATLEAVLAEAQESAHFLASELRPVQAIAVGEPRRPLALAPVATREPGSNVIQLRPRRA